MPPFDVGGILLQKILAIVASVTSRSRSLPQGRSLFDTE